jgi:hypothetical protein
MHDSASTGAQISGGREFSAIHQQHTAQFAVTQRVAQTQTAPAKGPLLLG